MLYIHKIITDTYASSKSCSTCLCSIPSSHKLSNSSRLQLNNCLQAFKFSFTA